MSVTRYVDIYCDGNPDCLFVHEPGTDREPDRTLAEWKVILRDAGWKFYRHGDYCKDCAAEL